MAGGAAEGRAVRCRGAFFWCGSLACVVPIVGSWCVARQCAKIRLVTYQLKGLTNRIYVPRMISGKGNEAARRSEAVKCSVRRWIAVGVGWTEVPARVPRGTRSRLHNLPITGQYGAYVLRKGLPLSWYVTSLFFAH